MKVLLLLGLFVLAASFSDPIAEDAEAERYAESDNKVEEVDTEASSANRFEAELEQLRNKRRYDATKCVAKVQFLKSKFLSESSQRKNMHNTILQILKRVEKITKPSFSTNDLDIAGVKDLLFDMQISLPKNASPKKSEVQQLLAKLASDLGNHEHSQKMALRNAALGCARKCRVRERTIRSLARKLNLWRSLAKRRYAIALNRSIKGLNRLESAKANLAAQISNNATAQVISVTRQLVVQQKEFSDELQNQLKARKLVFHLAIRKAQRARRAYRHTENTCSRLGPRIYRSQQHRSQPTRRLRRRRSSRRPRIGRRGRKGLWMRRLMQKVWNKRSRGCRRSSKNGRKGCGRRSRASRKFRSRARDARLLARAARPRGRKGRQARRNRRQVRLNRRRQIRLMKRRAAAIGKWLRGFLLNTKRSLVSAFRKHAAALRKQRRAAQKERRIRNRTPHAAFKIISYSSSSGLKLNLDPKTGIATAIRVNPGKFPPKYQWDFHKSSIKVIPLLPSAVSSLKKSVGNAIMEEDLSENDARRIVASVINKVAAGPKPKAALPARPSAPLALRAAVGEQHAKALCGKLKSWTDRYPQVRRELKKWYSKRLRALKAWYRKNGNLSRYNRFRRALRAVYRHRSTHLKAIAKVMFHVETKVRLQRKIAKVQRQIRAVHVALKEALRRRAKLSYPLARCPSGFARSSKNGECVKSAKPDPRDPQECGKNMVFINNACRCRRGFHQSRSRSGAPVCIANSRTARPLTRICKRGFFLHRHMCVQTCPKPTVAVKSTRTCQLPSAAKYTTPCGKNMTAKNGKCRCVAGFRRARGGDFCIRYSKTFLECRSGWFLSGKKCVRTCPAGLVGDSARRVCKSDLVQKEKKLEAAKRRAAIDAAKERLRKRQLLRAQLKKLQDQRRRASDAARKAAAALTKARQDADALAKLQARDASEANRHKQLADSARRKVAELAAQKTRAELLFRRLSDAHKNALRDLKNQLKRHAAAVRKAKATAAALLRARARAQKLAQSYKQAAKAASANAGKVASLRTQLTNDEIAKARRAARSKARKLRNKETVVMQKAKAQARKLAAAQRAAQRVEKKLLQKAKALQQKEKKLAANRLRQINDAKAKAARLESMAQATLKKYKQKNALLAKAREAARAAAARKAAALANAQRRARFHAAALARAKAEVDRRAADFNKATRVCDSIKCHCKTEECVSRARALNKTTTKPVVKSAITAPKTTKSPATPAPAPAPSTLPQLKIEFWGAFRRVRHLKGIASRLRTAQAAAVAAKKPVDVIAKITNAAALVKSRIAKVRSVIQKALDRAVANKDTLAWLQSKRGPIRSVLGKKSTWYSSKIGTK